MNEFTKEELEHMANGICFLMSKCPIEPRYFKEWENLGVKIQSLIDNYCEHELIHNGNGNYICSKCLMYGEL